MEYVPPYGSTNPDAGYNDINQATATEGDPVPAAAVEHPMREIVAAITAAGLTPNGGDLTQLTQAIQALIAAAGNNAEAISVHFATCSTAAATAEKNVTIANYTPKTGDTLYIHFSNANTADTPTLYLNGTSYPILTPTLAAPSSTDGAYFPAYGYMRFDFDGTNFIFAKTFGIGQKWYDKTSSRAGNTVYTNTTGSPIVVMIVILGTGTSITMGVGGQTLYPFAGYSSTTAMVGTVLVPAGAIYQLNYSSFTYWQEMR